MAAQERCQAFNNHRRQMKEILVHQMLCICILTISIGLAHDVAYGILIYLYRSKDPQNLQIFFQTKNCKILEGSCKFMTYLPTNLWEIC